MEQRWEKVSRRAVSLIITIVVLMGISMLTVSLSIVQASPATVLHLDPSSVIDPTLTLGDIFTVDVLVSDVEFLYAWQVNMSFEPTVLKIFDIVEGDFLKSQPEGTFGAKRIENEKGWALFGWTTVGPYLGVDGSGTLATVEFQVLAEGESLLEFETECAIPTLLIAQTSSSPPPKFHEIPFTAEDGYFNNFSPPSVNELIETIENWRLLRGTERSLIAKLNAAGHMLDMGKEDGAIRKLTAFTDRVQMLRGKILTNEQADYLTSEAQKIIDQIEG